ncbi:MAG: trimethylamine methyltransferase family protein, partial [Alphaproteobacteria bacterium]|nr:trimethylamine methyltransferase family protein [Alphaproteobacteria bacterium]
MAESETQGRRRGGRAARQAVRAAPLSEDIRPVRPGMAGGWYKPLSEADVLKIHNAALEVLETIGMCDAIPSCIEAVTAAGGRLNDEGRLLFPRALIEDTLAKA